MAKTEKGKKFVPVKPYTRIIKGVRVRVRAFIRSTPTN